MAERGATCAYWNILDQKLCLAKQKATPSAARQQIRSGAREPAKMRVIAGTYRSRPLKAPTGINTRPTSDRLRETLFNVLTNGATDHVLGSSFLDLYSGSGAVGIEALSRGAAHVTFVEQAPPALAALQKNLDSLGIRGKAPDLQISKQTVARFLRTTIEKGPRRFSTIFLDPPYEEATEYTNTLTTLADNSPALLISGALIIAEHRRKTPLAESYSTLFRTRVLEQGDAALSFFMQGEGKAS